MMICYVQESGRLGVANDPVIIAAYREEYTSRAVAQADVEWILAGFVPRPLLWHVVTRRILRGWYDR
jgi:hypothetical protein